MRPAEAVSRLCLWYSDGWTDTARYRLTVEYKIQGMRRTRFMKNGTKAKGSTIRTGNQRRPQMAHTRSTLNAENTNLSEYPTKTYIEYSPAKANRRLQRKKSEKTKNDSRPRNKENEKYEYTFHFRTSNQTPPQRDAEPFQKQKLWLCHQCCRKINI